MHVLCFLAYVARKWQSGCAILEIKNKVAGKSGDLRRRWRALTRQILTRRWGLVSEKWRRRHWKCARRPRNAADISTTGDRISTHGMLGV